MKTIIAGSREGVTFKDVLTAVRDCVWKVTSVVSATALGEKTEGEKVAKLLGVTIDLYPTNLEGGIKSEVMTNNADALIAVGGGQSKEIKEMIDLSNKKGLKVYVHPVKELENEMADKLTGMSEADYTRYEKLEKEHFGDYDKKVGIYAPKIQHPLSVTPEQAKTLLQSDAHHLLQLNPKERKEHYKNVQEKQGQKALDKLLAEVRKQRTKSSAMEM